MEPPLVLDSCHSTWYFDQDRKRFRRILKGLSVSGRPAMTKWRPYSLLLVDEGSDAFVVWLNPAGTRMLRSWRHVDGRCDNCDHPTVELTLEEIARAVATNQR